MLPNGPKTFSFNDKFDSVAAKFDSKLNYFGLTLKEKSLILPLILITNSFHKN